MWVQTEILKDYRVNYYALSKEAAESIIKQAMAYDGVEQVICKRNRVVDGQLKTEMKAWTRDSAAMRRHEDKILSGKPLDIPTIFQRNKKYVAEQCTVSTQVWLQDKISRQQEDKIAGELEQAHTGAVIVKHNREWWLDKTGQLRWKVIQ